MIGVIIILMVFGISLGVYQYSLIVDILKLQEEQKIILEKMSGNLHGLTFDIFERVQWLQYKQGSNEEIVCGRDFDKESEDKK